MDSCRMWESHSDSNRVSTVNCDSDLGSQPGDSRTRERRKFVVVTEGQEPRVGNQEDSGVLGILVHRLQEEIQKREQSPTGGPGNEQRSEREGQPLGPLEIKAPLTQVGVSAEISNGNPIGIYRRRLVSGATGWPIVRKFRPWTHRGRPEIPRDQPVLVPPKWTGSRQAIRRRSSGIWTGGCGRLKTFGRPRQGTILLDRGESRSPLRHPFRLWLKTLSLGR